MSVIITKNLYKCRNEMNTCDLSCEELEVNGIKISLTQSDSSTLAQCFYPKGQKTFLSLNHDEIAWWEIKTDAILYCLKNKE